MQVSNSLWRKHPPVSQAPSDPSCGDKVERYLLGKTLFTDADSKPMPMEQLLSAQDHLQRLGYGGTKFGREIQQGLARCVWVYRMR